MWIERNQYERSFISEKKKKSKISKRRFQGKVGDAIDKIEDFENFTIQQARKEFAEELKGELCKTKRVAYCGKCDVCFTIENTLKQMDGK